MERSSGDPILEAAAQPTKEVVTLTMTDRHRTPQRPRANPMDPADPTAMSGDGGQAGRLSHAERIGLLFHRSFDRWLTPFVIWIMRRTKGALADAWKVDALLLTTRGRRSGRERTVALQFFPDGDAMILTAANDGGAAHPGWSFNLRDEPVARVEVKGRTIPVRAAELAGDEAADWWSRIVRRDPDYERYARATSRPFPIFRLVPTAPPPTDMSARDTAA
jgi:deazaflavin-dependent oxidoreductase (nitroreductase family)